MAKTKKLLSMLPHIFLVALVIIILAGSLGYKNAGASLEDIEYITEFDVSVDGGKFEKVTLPHSFKNLKPGTPVTLTTTIKPQPDDTVYIKSVYAPAKIYLDDVLSYEFGDMKKYPDFMIDPATEVHLVETNGKNKSMNLRMEFKSPISRSSLTIQPLIEGSSKEVILERFHALGIPFVLSLAQIIYGFSLIFISLCIMYMDKKGIVFLWLGLLSLTTGAWAFGENNFTGVIFKNSTFLYVLSFVGFMTFIIPLINFASSIVDFENKKPLRLMSLFAKLSASAAILLQLLGIVSFSKSMYLFHAVLPLILIFLSFFTIYDFVKYKNVDARRFILPICILSLTAVLELANYKIAAFAFSSIFQVGILFFLLVMGIIAGISVKDNQDFKEKKRELDFQENLMQIQIKEQQSRSVILSSHEEILKQQRHDLRHHLNVIKELAGDDNKELKDYLISLTDAIPKADKRFCENRAVNSIFLHYSSICKMKDIELTLDLVIPESREHSNDAGLCVIFGNLLENAVEACERMTCGKRFITLKTKVQGNILTIAMDNSFGGQIKEAEGKYYSSKRDSVGIGTASIKSMAQKQGGDARFRNENHIFYSTVYIKI